VHNRESHISHGIRSTTTVQEHNPPVGSPSHRHQLLSNQPIDQNKAVHDTLSHSHRRTETSPADDRYHPPKAADGVTDSAENRGLRVLIQGSRRSARSQFGGADLFWVVAFGAWAYTLDFWEVVEVILPCECLAMVTRFYSLLLALRLDCFRRYSVLICFLIGKL
jgi:hypothetical protein